MLSERERESLLLIESNLRGDERFAECFDSFDKPIATAPQKHRTRVQRAVGVLRWLVVLHLLALLGLMAGFAVFGSGSVSVACGLFTVVFGPLVVLAALVAHPRGTAR